MSAPVLLPSASWNEPRWRGQRGFYEVYFIKLNLPEQGHALWLRYTLLAPRAGDPIAEVWGFYFDHRHPERNWSAKQSTPAIHTNWASGKLPLQLGVGNALHHAKAEGSLTRENETLSWELHWTPSPHAVGIFPARWSYFAPLPRTKYLSPGWDIRIGGTVSLHGERLSFSDAPGQQAHLWGVEYADEWVWAHCNAFAERDDAVFEALHATTHFAGRPVAMGMLCLRLGERFYALRGWRACRRMESHSVVGRWRFAGEERAFRIEGEISVEPPHLLGARYTTPSGETRWCHNTKVGYLSLRLMTREQGEWRLVQTLSTSNACAAEWVSRKPEECVQRWV